MSQSGQPAPHPVPHDVQPSRLGGEASSRGGGVGRRRIGALVLAFFLAMTAAAVGTTALWWYGQQSVDRVTVSGLRDTESEGAAEGGPEPFRRTLNVLLVGNDSREGLSQDQLTKLGTETAEGLLTDTIMLARLDPRRDGAAILSFPRDLLVTRCDGSRGRINAAYEVGEQTGVGGPACLVETVRDLTGLEVDNYVEVDFAGFIDVVDNLGGVTLHLEQPLEDRYAGLDLPAGCVSLDGAEALSFVRARHLDSDFGRIARQQRFMRELVDEVMSAGTLLDVDRLPSLVQSATDAVEVDSELSLAQMRRLAHSLRDASPHGLTTRTVPAVPRRIDGAAYVVAEEERADRLFSAFANGRLRGGHTGPRPRGDGTAADTPTDSGDSASADASGNEPDEPDYAGAQSPATEQCS